MLLLRLLAESGHDVHVVWTRGAELSRGRKLVTFLRSGRWPARPNQGSLYFDGLPVTESIAAEPGPIRDRDVPDADAVVATVAPIQQRYHDLSRHPEHVRDILRTGAERARDLATPKVLAAKQAIGLVPA